MAPDKPLISLTSTADDFSAFMGTVRKGLFLDGGERIGAEASALGPNSSATTLARAWLGESLIPPPGPPSGRQCGMAQHSPTKFRFPDCPGANVSLRGTKTSVVGFRQLRTKGTMQPRRRWANKRLLHCKKQTPGRP